jgi:hypothetical protein
VPAQKTMKPKIGSGCGRPVMAPAGNAIDGLERRDEMKRLHVLTPDAQHAKAIYDDLTAAGIDRSHLHVLTDDHAALRVAGLPEPTPMEEAMTAGAPDATLLTSIYGSTPPSPKVQEHKRDLEQGKVMLVFAVDADRVGEITRLVEKHAARIL